MGIIHPGLYLKETYMTGTGLTASKLARDLDVSVSTVNRLVTGKSNLSYEMIIKLAEYLDTTETLWLNLKGRYELNEARNEINNNTA